MTLLAAGTLGTIIATVAAFLLVTLLLVALLLFVKQKLSPSGPVTIKINGEKEIQVASGGTLLSTLGNEKIFLPSRQDNTHALRDGPMSLLLGGSTRQHAANWMPRPGQLDLGMFLHESVLVFLYPLTLDFHNPS